MNIWADADSLAPKVREVLSRRDGKNAPNTSIAIHVFFVSCKKLPESETALGTFVRVEQGTDEADNYILTRAESGDIIVTRDILFAEKAVLRGIIAINDRGTLWTEENIHERVSVRNFAKELRDAGVQSLGKRTGLDAKDIQNFAGALDKAISKASTALN
jgi:hypothetical protein